jgi:hypothetical protein
MFTARIHIRRSRRPSALALTAAEVAESDSLTGKILRFWAFCALLLLGLPAVAAGQATSTMQVSATVVPATAAWTGLSEARAAARQAMKLPSGRSAVRLAGVVQTRAQVLRGDDRAHLLVTIQHPYN